MYSLNSRLGFFNTLGPVFKALKFMVKVPYAISEEAKRGLLAEELESGREGIVLKNLQASYQFGTFQRDAKPANNWYKVKKKDTIDVKITGSEPPEQYYRDPVTGVYDLGRFT
jgi:ATP-dependent DNA ligase